MAPEYGVRCKDCASHNRTVLCSCKNQFSLFVFPSCRVSRILIFHGNFGLCAAHIQTHTHTHTRTLSPRMPLSFGIQHVVPLNECITFLHQPAQPCLRVTRLTAKIQECTLLNYKCNIINTTCFCLQHAALQHTCMFRCGSRAGITERRAHAEECGSQLGPI